MTENLGLFLLSVVGISLTGVMAPGPLTAAILTKGYRDKNAGVKIALGHGVVELPIILLIYFGFASYISSPEVKRIVGIIGGAMLIFMGIMTFRAMKRTTGEPADLPSNSLSTGVILTGANPYFLLWWATVGLALITGATMFGIVGLIVFIIVHWSCDLVWSQVLSMTVFKTRHLWTIKIQRIILVICAIVFIGFGVWFCVSVLRCPGLAQTLQRLEIFAFCFN